MGGRYYDDLEPCGTEAAYRRHLRHGEQACASCLTAHRVNVAEYRARRPVPVAERQRQAERRRTLN